MHVCLLRAERWLLHLEHHNSVPCRKMNRAKGQRCLSTCFQRAFWKATHNDFCLHFISQKNVTGHAYLQRRLEISFILNQKTLDITIFRILMVRDKGKWLYKRQQNVCYRLSSLQLMKGFCWLAVTLSTLYLYTNFNLIRF